jgi:translation initiation factor 2 subunit 1
MRLTAAQLKLSLLEIYEEWGWDLYDLFPHAFDGLKLAVTEPDFVFNKLTSIPENHKEVLITNIKKKLAAAPIKLRCTFNLFCFTYEGIDAIRDSLAAAREKTKDKNFPLTFALLNPPQEYKIELLTLDKNGGLQKLAEAAAVVAGEIKSRKGKFRMV